MAKWVQVVDCPACDKKHSVAFDTIPGLNQECRYACPVKDVDVRFGGGAVVHMEPPKDAIAVKKLIAGTWGSQR